MSEESKPGLLDRLPFFGFWRRTKGWMRRNKVLLYGILILLILFIVRPVLEILATLITALRPAITAILDNPAGRFIFYNLLAILLVWWVWRKVRGMVLRMFGLRAMRRFLDGINLMILGRWRAAIPHFEKVARTARWLKLEDHVPEHRDIAADARIKIATCHHRLREPDEALRWIATVRDQDMLTEHVRRNHAELRALTYDIHDEMEQETILRELEKTQGRDRKNRRVLLALRDRVESAGDLPRTRTIQQKLIEASEGHDKEQAQREMALLEYRIATKMLGSGETAASKKSLSRALTAQPGDVKSALLLGEIALADGDVPGALKAWSRAPGMPVFERIADLLASGRLAADREMELLLRYFPYTGTLIVLAEHHRRRGDFRRARAAIEKVLQATGESLPVLRLYAACLEGEGDPARAAELYRRALSMSLG